MEIMKTILSNTHSFQTYKEKILIDHITKQSIKFQRIEILQNNLYNPIELIQKTTVEEEKTVLLEEKKWNMKIKCSDK